MDIDGFILGRYLFEKAEDEMLDDFIDDIGLLNNSQRHELLGRLINWGDKGYEGKILNILLMEHDRLETEIHVHTVSVMIGHLGRRFGSCLGMI